MSEAGPLEWRVCDSDGVQIRMAGKKTRAEARYQGTELCLRCLVGGWYKHRYNIVQPPWRPCVKLPAHYRSGQTRNTRGEKIYFHCSPRSGHCPNEWGVYFVVKPRGIALQQWTIEHNLAQNGLAFRPDRSVAVGDLGRLGTLRGPALPVDLPGGAGGCGGWRRTTSRIHDQAQIKPKAATRPIARKTTKQRP